MMTSSKRKHDSDMEEQEDLNGTNPTLHYDEDGGIELGDIYVPPLPKAAGPVDANGPRLIITKIVNTNFKSYGEKQILGPFHKYFNAIVGPNGSGKSNVIDSLLFVFGYRASKIRSKKLSVLLHKSEKYPNVQSCTVEIHFMRIADKVDDPDMYEEIPDSKFVVSRTANKDNSSYYQVNGNRVQYKEVAQLLRTHGVDLDHNRFLILQGEVEQISLMKPKAPNEHDTGMLEYLEDIIGTVRYKEPLAKIHENIDFLTEQRAGKLNRVALAEKEKDELEQPMRTAVDFLKLENEVIKKKNFIYQRQIKQANDKLAGTEKDKSAIVEKYEELKDKLATILKEKATREEAFKTVNKKFDVLTKRKDQITESFNNANNRDENIQAEMVQVNTRRKKLLELLKKERATLEDLQKVPDRNKRDIEDCVKKEQQLVESRESLEAERAEALAALRADTIKHQRTKEQLQMQLVDLRKVVDDTKADFILTESKLNLYTSGEESEKKTLETLKAKYEETKTKISGYSSSLKELRRHVPLTETQLKRAQADLLKVRADETKALQELKVQRVQFEEKKSAMQANKSRGRILDSLMREKQEGRLPGLFGRLGDLGAIDAKYDVAISTACRPLDNIVVDSVDTAQCCIEFLRIQNIGRATFIALDKQDHLQQKANSTIHTPENIPRLFDLVRIEDPRVRTAFYYALRDTLVATDLDQASRTAYGENRFRVVTLAGDIIETAGTMCGGGGAALRGRIGRSVTCQTALDNPQKMEQLQASMDTLDERVRTLRAQQCRLEDQVNTLQSQLNDMKVELEKSTIELQSLQQQLPELQLQLKKQEETVKTSTTSPAELKKLQALVTTKRAKYEKAAEDADHIQQQVDTINKQIKEKTDKKMGAINKKLTDCVDLLDKIKAEIVKLKVAIKTAERNAKKSADKIADMEQEKSESEERIRTLQDKRGEIEKDAAVMLEKIQQITLELEKGQEEFSETREAIGKLTEEANKFKSEKIEFEQQLYTLDKVIGENKEAVHRTQHKLAQLTLQDIPEEPAEELRVYTHQELLETDTRHMEVELRTEEERVKAARPNLTAIKEYQKKAANYIQRTRELDEISEKRTQMRSLRDELRKKRTDEFYAGFNVIASKLKEMYQMITLGGDAELEMVDNFDPFSEGVVLNVRPPKKSWKHITNLSGGEKTLSSLALVFALHYYKPSPLYFMDEIDAALDFKNVSIVGNYIKERTKNTQFIIISLRSNMFELADQLIGIYKTYSLSKTVAINARAFTNENVHVAPAEDVAPPSTSHAPAAAAPEPLDATRDEAPENGDNAELFSDSNDEDSH